MPIIPAEIRRYVLVLDKIGNPLASGEGEVAAEDVANGSSTRATVAIGLLNVDAWWLLKVCGGLLETGLSIPGSSPFPLWPGIGLEVHVERGSGSLVVIIKRAAGKKG
jgi:hypothetical protein